MIDPKEFLFTVDENNQPIKSVPRNRAHAEGIWHRSTGVWVVNDGKVLCQKRSLKKDTHAGMWQADFGGHMTPKEIYLDNAQKELEEETGIKLDRKNFKQVMTYRYSGIDQTTGIDDREFMGIFVANWGGDISKLKLEADEVQAVAWRTLDELAKLIGHDDSWVAHGYESELISELHGKNWGQL